MSRVQDFGPAPLDEPEAYPGTWPSGAVLIERTSVMPILQPSPALLADQGRTPLMAYGADACPAQLARKALPGRVLLVPTVLRNHLVVYAGHVTAYGAIPATVVRWPGASCAVFMLWLTPRQHDVVDRSQDDGYDRVMLPTREGLVAAYRARSGYIPTGRRQPVRVAGVACTGQSLPMAMTQVEVRSHHRALAG